MTQAAILSEAQKEQNWRREYPWIVGIFYFFQGFYMIGLAAYALPMMANWEVPPATQTTVIAAMGLPLYVKMFPSLLSDRVPIGRWGRRKPYSLIGGLLYIPGFILLITNQYFGAAWLGAILITLIAWMLVDSVLDALTVDITPRDRSAQMQSSAWGSRLLGGALSTLLIPTLGPRIGWTPVLVILGASALIQSMMALMLREIPVSREALREELPLGNVMRETFGRPLGWLSVFFFLFFTVGGTDRLINIYLLTELGWNSSPEMMTTYGVLGMVGRFSGVLGALLVGRLPPRWLASFRFYAAFLAFQWLLIAPWLLVARAPENLFLIFAARILINAVLGMNTSLKLALTMRVCPKSIEGFTFALMGSVGSFSTNALGPKTATAFADRLGLIPSIFTLLPYGLLSLVFLYPMLKQLNKLAKERIMGDRAESLPVP